jgi:hypothetical protein
MFNSEAREKNGGCGHRYGEELLAVRDRRWLLIMVPTMDAVAHETVRLT